MAESNSPLPRVALLTLGCASNLVDSEHIASVLEANGVEVTHELKGAAVAIVNTCGFIEAAKQESIDAILDVAGRHEGEGPDTLIVAGCLSQRYGEELRELLPEVDAFIGIDPEGVARLALRALGRPVGPLPSHVMLRSRRLTPAAWSYLRISHGCDNRCTYCAIPTIRGPLRSRPSDELIAEARFLVEQGVRELNVIAQDTANYGVDLGRGRCLHRLLRELCRVDGLEWIRLLYVHPAHVYEELVEVLATEPKLCPYLDVPLQHISDRILARMGRKVTRARIEAVIARLREAVPGITLRTTFMTGFAGETEAEFETLLQFVRAMRFDRVGCFAYSVEEGTPAARLADHVPEKVREERRDRLMAAQQEIAFELAAARAGERTTALVEEAGPLEGDLQPARSRREAPDVDPLIYLEGAGAGPGEFADVEIVGSVGYDCVARLLAKGCDEG